MSIETKDEYGFPLIFEPEVLAGMQAALDLPGETVDCIRRYFEAASNLYARISLRRLFEIYNSQNAPVSEADFLAVAELISHERHYFTILGRDVFYEDEVSAHPLDRELVASHLYDLGCEYYYALEEQQAGKDYYIPEKETLLKYEDKYYYETIPQHSDIVRYLRTKQRKLRCAPEDIAGDLHLALLMDGDYSSIVDNSRCLGVRFFDRQDFLEFLGLLISLSRHTRRYSLRGHTPLECNLPPEDPEAIAADIEFEENCEDPLIKMGQLLRHKLDSPQPTTLSGKPSKNAPCPCGSGRKYKNCCGMGK